MNETYSKIEKFIGGSKLHDQGSRANLLHDSRSTVFGVLAQ